MKALVSLLLACAMLSGCATTYVGPHPDFTKTGPEANAEYEKFEFGTGYGNLNLYGVKMGNKVYYRESVDPIINAVSSTSTSKLQKMKTAKYVQWVIFAATIAAIFQPRDSWAYQTGYWIGLGALVGNGIYINVMGMKAAEDYNKDLKSKFSPALAFTKTF
jgi:hypothetical protein